MTGAEMTDPEPEELAERTAPLDALLVDAALGPKRRLATNSSTVRFAARLASHPVATGRRLGRLAADLARVGVGTSTIAPSKRDRRFADPAWSQNPLLHRAVQGYLATNRAAGALVDDAGLDWRDDQRVRFLVDNLVQALSPSNLPLVNPESAKAAIDTAGGSLARGSLSLLRDMAAPPRIPEMVDTSPFAVGRTVAVTPGAVVLRTEVLELIQYRPQTERVREIPLLIAPPTINKYYALDLAPGRSLIEYLVRGRPAGVRDLVAQPGRPACRVGPGHVCPVGARRVRRGPAHLPHRPGGADGDLRRRHHRLDRRRTPGECRPAGSAGRVRSRGDGPGQRPGRYRRRAGRPPAGRGGDRAVAAARVPR